MPNLAETMRPTNLSEVIGQEAAKRAIQSWIDKDSFPRCQLYTGPVGTGKSSLAGIVARASQGDTWDAACDIRQINAGTVGKVDDARALAAESDSRPFIGRYRVFILEEAHRMTDAAQDAILVPMENNLWTMWILTSSEPDKLLPAIRSRCSAATFDLKPLNKAQVWDLIDKASEGQLPQHETTYITEALVAKDILYPREILGILDQRLSGVDLEDCIHGSEHEPLYKDICGSALRGDWAKCSSLLAKVKTADSRGMVSVLSAFLRSELLRNPVGPKADAIAACLVGIDQTGFQDGVAYGAVTGLLYKTCKALGGAR